MIRLSLIALALIFSLGNAVKVEKSGWDACFLMGAVDPACQTCASGGKSIFDVPDGDSFCPSEACRRSSCVSQWKGCSCPAQLQSTNYVPLPLLPLSGTGDRIADLQCGTARHGDKCSGTPVCKTDYEYIQINKTSDQKPYCACLPGTGGLECKWYGGACFKKCNTIKDWQTLRKRILDTFKDKPALIVTDQTSTDKTTKTFALDQRLAADTASYSIPEELKQMSVGTTFVIPATGAGLPCAENGVTQRKAEIIVTCEASTNGDADYRFTAVDTEAVTCGISKCANTTQKTNCVDWARYTYQDNMVCAGVLPSPNIDTSIRTAVQGLICNAGLWSRFNVTENGYCSKADNVVIGCGGIRGQVPNGVSCPIDNTQIPVNPKCVGTGFSCSGGTAVSSGRYFKSCSFSKLNGYDSCWLGNSTGILNCISGNCDGLKPDSFPHGHQCIPMCEAGKVRKGTEGPYCNNGDWVLKDRYGNSLQNLISCADPASEPTTQAAYNKAPIQCKNEGDPGCNNCVFAKNKTRLLGDNIERIGVDSATLAIAAYIDWPFCGDMKHLETAQVLCKDVDSVLEGNEYVQCYNGKIYLGGWFYSDFGSNPSILAAKSTCRSRATPPPPQPSNASKLQCGGLPVNSIGPGFVECGSRDVNSLCNATCAPGFIPYVGKSQPYEFETYFTSQFKCVATSDSKAEWQWAVDAVKFACMDTCRTTAVTLGTAVTENTPGSCDSNFLCDGVCSLYNPAGYECTGPACQYDGQDCARTKKDRVGFSYDVKVRSFRLDITFDSIVSQNTWIGIYSSNADTNDKFVWAKFIGGTSSFTETIAVSSLVQPTFVNGTQPVATIDLVNNDYEFRIFPDLITDESTKPFFTSGFCYGGACNNGKVASHTVPVKKELMKKKSLHAVTQEVYDLLQPELHLNDREEFLRRIEIIKKVEVSSQHGESPHDLFDDLYHNIKDKTDTRAYFEVTKMKRRILQTQQAQAVWKQASIPGRCLSEHPDCLCSDWGNGECNPACNNEDCQYDGLDCGCTETEIANAGTDVTGVISSSFTQCNNRPRFRGKNNETKYYPVGTVCQAQCSDGRISNDAVNTRGALTCRVEPANGLKQKEHGGHWEHNCLPQCPLAKDKVIESLKTFLNAINRTDLATAVTADLKFQGCGNNSAPKPYANGACDIICDSSNVISGLRIECMPLLSYAAGKFGEPAYTWGFTDLGLKAFDTAKTICSVAPPPPSPPVATPPVAPLKCPDTTGNPAFVFVGDCKDKSAGDKCNVNCSDTTKTIFNGNQATCSLGKWLIDAQCIGKCPVPAGGSGTDRNNAVEYGDSCKATGLFPMPGNPSSCEYKCGNGTLPKNSAGGKLYDGSSCPAKIACLDPLKPTLSLNSSNGVSTQCLSTCKCDEFDGDKVVLTGTCKKDAAPFKSGTPVSIDCGADANLVNDQFPVCYDDITGLKRGIFRWLKPDGTGIKFEQRVRCTPKTVVTPSPPTPSPPSPPQPVPTPVAPPNCTRDQLLTLYKQTDRNWVLKYEYAVTGKYDAVGQKFDDCPNYQTQYAPGSPALDVICLNGGTGTIACSSNGVWVGPDCPKKCPRLVENGYIIEQTDYGQSAKASCQDPNFVPLFSRNTTTQVWQVGPYCNNGIFVNKPLACVHKCYGQEGVSPGVCNPTGDSMCDYFCQGDVSERNCQLPSCKGFVNATLKCTPPKVSSFVARPVEFVIRYTATAPLPKNAHVEINQLAANGAKAINYLFFLPQLQFSLEDLYNETAKTGYLIVGENYLQHSNVDSNSTGIRKAFFADSRLQFTFFQDLSRDTANALATGTLCGGQSVTPALCTKFTPRAAVPLTPPGAVVNVTDKCSFGGCSCGQIGDGICDPACLSPDCPKGEEQDCRCYNPEYYTRGGVLSPDCAPGSSKAIGESCSFTCPGESTPRTTTCAISFSQFYPTFSWNSSNVCKQQCKGIPLPLADKTEGFYIRADQKECNGTVTPVNHGTKCVPSCVTGTLTGVDAYFVCDDGEWFWKGFTTAYCASPQSCKLNDLLNGDTTKIDDVLKANQTNFVQGLSCVNGAQSVVTVNQQNQTSATTLLAEPGVTCQYQCNSGYEPKTAAISCSSGGVWSAKLSTLKCDVSLKCNLLELDQYFSGGTYTCNNGTNIDLSRFTDKTDRKVEKGTTCSFTCSTNYLLTPPQAGVTCGTGGKWINTASSQPIFSGASQTIYYPICHPPCLLGVPVNGQQRGVNGSLKCIGTPMLSSCAGWTCGTSPTPFFRDTCSGTAEPVCYHAQFVSDTTESPLNPSFKPLCTDIASCWKWCTDNVLTGGCDFAKLQDHNRVWAVPFTANFWNRKLPYCFAPCNTTSFTRSSTFTCDSPTGFVQHGQQCNVKCNDKDAAWQVNVVATVPGVYNNFPVCYDGVFRGNEGTCVKKDSAVGPGNTACKYSELNQFLREQKLLGFKCEELNKEGATFKTSCHPGYQMYASKADLSDKELTVTCKKNANGLFSWIYSLAGKELKYTDVPRCAKAKSCSPLTNTSKFGLTFAVTDKDGIVCPSTPDKGFCSIKCQPGYIPYHTPRNGRTQAVYCLDEKWQGADDFVCKEPCADIMKCLPNTAAKAKYTYKCDNVCQGNFLGDLDGIDCAGPACNYDSSPGASDSANSRTCSENLFGATLKDVRSQSYRIIVPVGKRLTNQAWVGYYIKGETDTQKYADRIFLDRLQTDALTGEKYQDVTFTTLSQQAQVLGADKATDFEIKIFPDAAWDSKPLSSFGVTAGGGISQLSGGTGSAAPAGSSGSGPWMIIAIVFIILFIIAAVAAVVLFMKVKGSGGQDNAYSKYTERL